ncbi:hypothetical protein GONAM_61_00610 [Gordonia namibiensis NBRC 108229]|uniref:GAF domain-containing protein n=1 Tax=Gordonia namibiensis NBRC 108229 TaxID=1208314 RepID=K6XEP1_9ACTN|nr:GAF domain-containing protein [Gordonia namibiensis]GAC02823.1 hypothetical protein GONAM_61_00610 [Gordonia namibiensis NBRC 108229]
MTEAWRVSTAVASVTGTMVHEFDVPTVLQNVAERTRLCFEAHSAAVVLLDPRREPDSPSLHIVAESSAVDHASYPLLYTSGPALESARSGAIALISDLTDATDTRWPQYRRHALEAGFRGVRAFPVVAMHVPIGAIVVHTVDPWSYDQPNQAGQVFADLTSLALSAAGGADARQVRLEESIDSVLEGVTVTATAVGIIAEIRGVDLIEARVLLTRLARAHAVTPTTHARSIVAAQREHPRDPESTGLLGFPEFGTLPADES